MSFDRTLDLADGVDAGLLVAWPNLFEALAVARDANRRADLSDGLSLLGSGLRAPVYWRPKVGQGKTAGELP